MHVVPAQHSEYLGRQLFPQKHAVLPVLEALADGLDPRLADVVVPGHDAVAPALVAAALVGSRNEVGMVGEKGKIVSGKDVLAAFVAIEQTDAGDPIGSQVFSLEGE